MSWGIAETASEIEKIKSESADYLNGLNSCGVIDWNTYNYAFDFYDSLLIKAYEQGRKDAQPEPCEDAVSRKAVKDGFVEMCSLICPYTEKQRYVMCGSCLLGTAFDVLEATQSVTPKQRTGKWIPQDHNKRVGNISTCVYYYPTCSECGQVGNDTYKYCPHCGAKMGGDAE